MIGLIRTGLPADQTIGVALSGGGDSTALLHLCLAVGLRVEAVTVDHGLRPESAAEAAGVAADCAALGVGHETRLWRHGPLGGNLMDAARRARLGLIADWARSRGIGVVALGHTRDDQAETVLMGLARAAGLAGLSGMRPEWHEAELRFCRPLLQAGREELRQWLRSRGVRWIDDPTNENDRYARVRARKALETLAPLGITAERLAQVAGHLAQVQSALAVQVSEAARQFVTEVSGALRLDAGLCDAPQEIRRQVMSAALVWLAGTDYAPRAPGIERMLAALATGGDATLAGCRLRRGWLVREPRALGGAVPVGALWDRRWRVIGPEGEVRALGPEGLRQVPDWRAQGLPREVLAVTPGVWHGSTLLSAPLADHSAGWQAELVQPFHLFGLVD
ncbi:MAG: tRNA lysidine(34) synthetase TilS [Tabrizicola sp.]|nr:tRNA lysidine(34) synthetase TilS [Tabrizicola sp.]